MSRRAPLVVLLGLLLSSCGSSESEATPNDSGPPADAKETGPSDAVAETKEPCSTPAEEPGAQCVKTVSGKVVDSTGAPVAKKLISICSSICFFGETKDDGTFVSEVGTFIKVANYAVNAHGRPNHASLYEKLPATTSDSVVLAAPIVLPVLPATGERIPRDASKKVTSTLSVKSAGITLTIEAGTEVELDLEDEEMITKGQPGDHFRAVKVQEKDYPGFVKGANVKLLFAASPFDAKFIGSKKVPIEIAETGGLPEGSAVEIVAMGNDFVKTFTAGKLEVVAKGKVTGGKIVTDAGEGLTTLTWIGVRAKP